MLSVLVCAFFKKVTKLEEKTKKTKSSETNRESLGNSPHGENCKKVFIRVFFLYLIEQLP